MIRRRSFAPSHTSPHSGGRAAAPRCSLLGLQVMVFLQERTLGLGRIGVAQETFFCRGPAYDRVWQKSGLGQAENHSFQRMHTSEQRWEKAQEQQPHGENNAGFGIVYIGEGSWRANKGKRLKPENVSTGGLQPQTFSFFFFN